MQLSWNDYIRRNSIGISFSEDVRTAIETTVENKNIAAQASVSQEDIKALSLYFQNGGDKKDPTVYELLKHAQMMAVSKSETDISLSLFRILQAASIYVPVHIKCFAMFDAEQFPINAPRLLWTPEEVIKYERQIALISANQTCAGKGNFTPLYKFAGDHRYKLNLKSSDTDILVTPHHPIENTAQIEIHRSLSTMLRSFGGEEMAPAIRSNIRLSVNGKDVTPILAPSSEQLWRQDFALDPIPAFVFTQTRTFEPIELRVDDLIAGQEHYLTIEPIPPMTEIPGMGGALFIGMPVALR